MLSRQGFSLPNLLVIVAIAFHANGDRAQAAESWELLAAQNVDRAAAEATIELPGAAPPVNAIRMVAGRRRISLSKVVVGYVDGTEHVEDRRIELNAGDRTKAIDRRTKAAVVKAIRLFIDGSESRTGVVRIEVWGFAAAVDTARTVGVDELATINQGVRELYTAGKYGEAIPLAEKALELTLARKGSEHLDTAEGVSWLARLYETQGRFAEAGSLYKRILAIHEKAL